jgi:hypothetical protein
MKQGDLVFDRNNTPGVVIIADYAQVFGGTDTVMTVLWAKETKTKLTLRSLLRKVSP